MKKFAMLKGLLIGCGVGLLGFLAFMGSPSTVTWFLLMPGGLALNLLHIPSMTNQGCCMPFPNLVALGPANVASCGSLGLLVGSVVSFIKK